MTSNDGKAIILAIMKWLDGQTLEINSRLIIKTY